MPVDDFTTTEVWRPIAGFPDYEVSSFGRVRSLAHSIVRCLPHVRPEPFTVTFKSKLLKPQYGRYGSVHLRVNNETHPKRIYRLVLEAFVGPCPEGMEGCHNDGNHKNNHVLNLRWDTHTENVRDSIKQRTHSLVGENHHLTRLSEEDILVIRSIPKYHGVLTDLALAYGVTQPTLWSIRNGKTWKHLL